MRALAPLSALFLGALLLPACGGGGGSAGAGGATIGDFRALGTNLANGATWELNKPIRIEFNHPVAPGSVHFGSILIRAVAGQGVTRPVTGSFSLEADGRAVVFQPTCPTAETSDDGAFLPGGLEYELLLPTRTNQGSAVLRDTGGHPLSTGLTRRFRTPRPPAEPLFLDLVPTPPAITGIDWPSGLNFFTDPDPPVEIRLDQAVDARASNLATGRLYLRYSDAPASGGAASFDADFRVPGGLVLAQNCSADGAVLWFEVAGILPPDRHLQLVMTNEFADISGQSNAVTQTTAVHTTPSLTAIYQDPSWSESDETVDEFRDDFLDSRWLDAEAALTAPPATAYSGEMGASFDYPGRYVSPDDDFYYDGPGTELYTDGVVFFTASNHRTFKIENGVLYVDDFTLASGSALRGRGSNPLVIYAQGDVVIDGELDLSGNRASWPSSLNSPQFPEGGAFGECGGGRGGTSSYEQLKETLRGEAGEGAFRVAGQGGEGGEGGFTQTNDIGFPDFENARMIAGGGGGGTFARTPNVAILWNLWTIKDRPSSNYDDKGPDHKITRHPYWPDGVYRPSGVGLEPDEEMLPVFGGEDGVRGSSWESDLITPSEPYPDPPHGMYGMEDESVDIVNPPDDNLDFDPAWDSPARSFDLGHPTRGPDGGRGGPSVFSPLDTSDDFWGRRLNSDGSVTVGELLTPWAGSGGGAGGDSQRFWRWDNPNPPPLTLPTPVGFPTNPFNGWRSMYRKAAPGGGGGGQLLILAIGSITLGKDALIVSNGGTGQGGETGFGTDHQVAGSGGGSGGHIVLHSATRIDLSAIDVGQASTAAQVLDLDAAHVVRAVGGRRGWAATKIGNYDGNGNQMVGRGGAGGNGVIQIHVPDPSTDIDWPSKARSGIRQFIHHGSPTTNPVDVDRLEGILSVFCTPQPYSLLPFFSSESQFQSRWIDTGTAFLRDPQDPNGQGYEGPYPDFGDAVLRFLGTDAEGYVETTSGQALALGEVASGAQSGAAVGLHTIAIDGATTLFPPEHLRHPATLIGYDVLPDRGNTIAAFQVVDALYERALDRLTLSTRPSDGALSFAVNPGQPWSVRQKFFRVATGGERDRLPNSASIRVLFQGCDDPEDPGTFAPTPNAPNDWTADPGTLKGKRFFRYRVTFDVDAQGGSLGPASPRPTVDYLKVPFVW